MIADTITDQDWKQAAAAQSQSNEDIEKSFLDAAYAAVANKATPIMRSPYRVGFEIVFKNDDNTRIVGVFVFRVGKELYYAPVFFLNGSIKGTDLFYRANAKRFVPMTNEWVEYLINLSETKEGSGIPITERAKARNQLNMFMIIEPPNSFNSGGRKYASEMPLTMEVEESTKLATEILAQWPKSLADIPAMPEESILKKFIEEDGGFSAIRKLANTVEKDNTFAQALVLASKPENFAPELEVLEKEASAPLDALILHRGVLYNANVKSASEKDLAKGYQFEDHRKAADVNEVVFADATQSLVSVDEPGIYKVMLANGDQHEMMCGYFHHLGIGSECCPKSVGAVSFYGYENDSHGKSQQLCLVDLETKHSMDFNSEYQKALGGFVRDLQPDKSGEPDGKGEIGVDKPTSGKAYRIFNTKNETFSEPFYVKSVKSKNGMTVCTICDGWRLQETGQITVNPDFTGQDEKEKVFGNCCRFIEVASEKGDEHGPEIKIPCDLNLGDRAALNRMIFENGYKQASIRKRNEGFLVELDDKVQEFSKLAALTFLMTRCDLTECAAEDVIAQIKGNDKYAFFYEPKFTKSALNVRFNQWPEFYENVNSEYNTLEQPDSQWAIRADSDRPVTERNRVGDKYSGGSQNQDSIDTRSPMQLYQSSQEKGMGSMFEHGVVGSLVNTYDSMAMLDKYMPDLEQALDRLGRILFLFYWKPEDFTQAFGSDDQSQLENKLTSCFRSFGDLTLEMLKKNRQAQQGTASLA